VDVPLLDEGVKEDFLAVAIVVLRCMCVVSADGGGGSDETESAPQETLASAVVMGMGLRRVRKVCAEDL
jgi:hypothetical protein